MGREEEEDGRINRVSIPYAARASRYIPIVHFRTQPSFGTWQGEHVFTMFCSDRASLLLAASKCGLFCQDGAPASSCTMSFIPRQYNIRLARHEDAAALVVLDAACWPEHMRGDAAAIERRLHSRAAACLVATVRVDESGTIERIAGALYMQRISSLHALRASRFPSDTCADAQAAVLHFYSVSALAEFQHLQLGSCLRNFAKQLALHEGIASAVATTRCSQFVPGPKPSADTYRQYALNATDPTLLFHISGGAKITGVIPEYRPEDHENLGHAVVAEYIISTSSPEAHTAHNLGTAASRAVWDRNDVFKAVVEELSSVLGISVSQDRIQDSPFMDLGLDSLGMTVFSNRICSRFDLKLSSTDMFDHPNTRSLVSFICDEPNVTMPSIRLATRRHAHGEPIAVVDINCVFPGGCDSVEDFWSGLCSGRDFTSDAPASWNTETKTFRGGFLQDVQRCQFDPEYFGLSLSELQSL